MKNDISLKSNRHLIGFSPTLIFLTIFVTFQFVPGLYIYLSNTEEYLYGEISGNYSDAAFLYMSCVGLFLTTFILVRYVILSGGSFFIKKFSNLNELVSIYAKSKKLLMLPRMFVVFSLAAIFIYFITGGYEKLFLIGSGMDAWEYRLIGYDDRSRILTAILEISRRVFLPVAILYYLLLKKIGKKISVAFLLTLICFQLLAASMTMDRAPFFILLILFGYSHLSGIQGIRKVFKLLLISFSSIVLLAGVITNLQYNIIDFSIVEALGMGLDFFVHRMWLVPSIAPIELSFSMFALDSEKLMLEYSRLGALVTGNYVGTSDGSSIFVTPVGAVGDIWRNFGLGGIFVISMFLGLYFKALDLLANRVSAIALVVGNFLVIALCFYWVMGVFFSQGAFFTTIVCYLYFKYEARVFRIALRQVSTAG